MLVQLLLTPMNHIAHISKETKIERRLYALAVAHFILAIMAGVVSILALISAIAFSTIMADLMGGGVADTYLFYRSLGAGTSFMGLALSGVSAAAGWNLLTLRWGKASFVLESATLLLFPFGTILGIATLLMLAHRSVRERFGAAPQPANAQ